MSSEIWNPSREELGLPRSEDDVANGDSETTQDDPAMEFLDEVEEGQSGIEFVGDGADVHSLESNEDIDSLNDLGTLVDVDLEPEPGAYKTNQVITPGEAGFVQAKVYHFVARSDEVLDSVTGVPLEEGELVVAIGSAGPIRWESFKMLHEQSGGTYTPGITISDEDLN